MGRIHRMAVKVAKSPSFFDILFNNTAAIKKPVKTVPKKMSRADRKRLEKTKARALDELETDLLMFAEVMIDDCF